MNRIKQLIESYVKYIAVPWRADAAPAQRVIFCIYKEEDELRLRVALGEFAIATKGAGHTWASFDLTDSFATWLSSQKYKDSYFQKPHLLSTLLPKYLDYISDQFQNFLGSEKFNAEGVVALTGVGSLFGLLKVKDVVDRIAPMISGRLLIFFPGSYENNNYSLLDGYDGWNYLAVPITADKDI